MRDGDVVTLGRHRIACGDSRDRVLRDAVTAGESVCTLLYDPPFEAASLIAAVPLDVCATIDDALVFGSCRHPTARTVSAGPHLAWRFGFVWDAVQRAYVDGAPLLGHKTCDWFSRRRSAYRATPASTGAVLASVYAESITTVAAGRPHAKPVRWLALLLANCTRGAVFEPFAGWGSGLVACDRLSRPWRGIERSPARCDAIVERYHARSDATSEATP